MGSPASAYLIPPEWLLTYIPSRLFFAHKPPDFKAALKALDLRTAVEQLVVKPSITPELLESLADDLKNHLEGRIWLFLQKMLFLYKTKLPIDSYKQADFQVGEVPSKGANEPAYVAAHSGTLSTLRVAQSAFSDASVSLGQNTSFYYAWNTTTYLPLVANQIDSAIDRSLRDVAIDILNKVSSGAICPKMGLHDFLGALTKVIDSIYSQTTNEQEQKVLTQYSRVADTYYENTDNGYPLIQKLCLKPIGEVVDNRFYMSIQEEMHKRFKAELPKPEAVSMPILPANINLRLLQSEVVKLAFIPPKTARTYVKLCTLADTVRAAAINYFIYLQDLTSEKRTDDLRRILNIKSLQTVQQVELSKAARALYDAALGAIKPKTENPRNMHLILPSVLIAISRDLIPERQVAPLQTDVNSEKQLREQIQKRIDKSKKSPTAEKHISCCAKAADVRAFAKAFFNELLDSHHSLREIEIDKLFLITPAKRGSAGLSPKALAFYGAVLEKIQKNFSVKNPKTLPLVLCRLLLDQSSLG